ncbi:MAG: HEAT repeat domain-containing protein [Thermoanaerobaculia bacterium]|nr:HEAT repeat domain-containing protein [Thermoanaerobaculia bacterium]
MVGQLEDQLDAALAELPTKVRVAARRDIAALRKAADLTPEALGVLLADDSAEPRLRLLAAWLTGLVREQALTPVLESVVVTTTNIEVLWEVAKALCRLEADPAVFRQLLESDSSVEHRKAAAFALGSLEDNSAVRLLIKILASEEEDAGLRAQVAEALGYLRNSMALYTLMAAAVEAPPEVRFWSVFALGTLGDERARPLLERISRTDHVEVEGWWPVSQEAISALEELMDRQGVGS